MTAPASSNCGVRSRNPCPSIVQPGVAAFGYHHRTTHLPRSSSSGAAGFVGKVRDDQLGGVFTHDIRASGVSFTTPPAVAGPATARSFILVTPDAERTMNTYLGIAAEVTVDDVHPDLVASAGI